MNNDQIPNNVNMNGGGVPNPVPTPINPADNGMGMNVNPVPMPQPEMGAPVSPVAPSSPMPQPEVGAPVTPVVPSSPMSQPEVGAPVTPVAPSSPMPQPEVGAPVQPSPNMNLNPMGVVETPVAVTPEPTVSPLMSTPLTADTNLNPTTPVAPDMNQPTSPVGMPAGPGIVPPVMGGMPGSPMPNMGIPVPPQAPVETGKEKKPMNKTLILVLAIVLVAAVGFGVWFVLFGSKSKTEAVTINPFLKEIQLGVDLDLTSASTFAIVSGMPSSECSVSSTIDTKVAKTYEYTITCGSVSSGTQTVEVKDTLPPVVVVKDVTVVPNAEVTAKDFIVTVEDASIDENTEYVRFVQEVSTTTEGTYEVSLEISDLYNNTVTETAKLIVDAHAPEYYYACELDGDEEGEVLAYRFGIDFEGYIHDASKVVTFTYSDEASYNEAVESYNSSNSINGIEGVATFNQDKLQISVSTTLSVDSLPGEFDTDLFSEEYDIQDILGDSCKREE